MPVITRREQNFPRSVFTEMSFHLAPDGAVFKEL